VEGPSTRLRIRVVPGARREGIVGRLGDAWKLRVAAPPERGAANAAATRLLARSLALPDGAVTIVSGQHSRDKIVDVAGITPAELEDRLGSYD
jgi:uncharacterized protein YggU (UPF0235/DUF167 family)